MRRNYIAGKWVSTARAIEVRHPFDNEVFDTVPQAGPAEVEAALAAAERGVAQARAMGAHRRYEAMLRAADLFAARADELAEVICLENGKTITDARLEAARGAEVARLAAFEGAMLRGEQLPYESAFNGAGRMGMTLRVPCGIVVAIAPFNFPFNLAMHKVAPALATGNAVILKPATTTPVSAVILTEVFHEAGFDGDLLQLVTGPGASVGEALAADPRVRKVSFTGSRDVGRRIAAVAGIKKLSLELGSNSPMLVLPDADLDAAAAALGAGGYVNNGQVCTSLQRAIVTDAVHGDFTAAATAVVDGLRVGPARHEDSQVSALIDEGEAARLETWIKEAQETGAQVTAGGERIRALLLPTLVTGVTEDMRLAREEAFGPVVAVMRVADVDAAIALANRTEYGLAAGVFTQDVNSAMRCARELDAGTVNINWSSQWRADFMPFGGLKDSGIGKEGPAYACREMTEVKAVAFHGT